MELKKKKDKDIKQLLGTLPILFLYFSEMKTA